MDRMIHRAEELNADAIVGVIHHINATMHLKFLFTVLALRLTI